MAGREFVVHSDPDILSGTPVFVGSRVPLKNLIDYLAAGDNLYDFLDHFPSVSREQAVAALEAARDIPIAGAYPARWVGLTSVPSQRCTGHNPEPVAERQLDAA